MEKNCCKCFFECLAYLGQFLTGASAIIALIITTLNFSEIVEKIDSLANSVESINRISSNTQDSSEEISKNVGVLLKLVNQVKKEILEEISVRLPLEKEKFDNLKTKKNRVKYLEKVFKDIPETPNNKTSFYFPNKRKVINSFSKSSSLNLGEFQKKVGSSLKAQASNIDKNTVITPKVEIDRDNGKLNVILEYELK